MKKQLYEIIWHTPCKGGMNILPMKEYLSICWSMLERWQVVNIDKTILEKTIEWLKVVSFSDEKFEIREIQYDCY